MNPSVSGILYTLTQALTHSHTKTRLFVPQELLAPSLVLQLPPLDWAAALWARLGAKYGQTQASERGPRLKVNNWHTHAVLKRWLGNHNTDFPNACAWTNNTCSNFQLRRKLLRQQPQCVHASVFTFKYEMNSSGHWVDQSHSARAGNYKSTEL